MESVNRKVILIALILALFTSFMIYVYIKNATTKTEIIEYTNIYVATKTMLPKYKITDGDLKQIKVTKEYINPKAVLNKSDIVGKRLRDRVIEGEQILKDRLVDDNKITLAYSIPEGKRAVSVNVNEQVEVANLLKPGDLVDVIASFSKVEITKTIIQNVQVLALGQDMVVEDDKVKELPKTVTLAVSLQDAEKLVYASEFGVIRLALKPIGDSNNVDTQGVIISDLVGDKGVLILPK